MAIKLNTLGIVSAVLVLVGLILALVGVLTPVLFNSKMDFSIKLSETDGWEVFDEFAKLTDKSTAARPLTIVAFVVTLVSAAAALANSVLAILGKNIKPLGVASGAVMIVGGILVLGFGLWLAIAYSDILGWTGEYSLLPSTGIYLGFVGGMLGGISSVVITKKIAKKAKSQPEVKPETQPEAQA